MFSIETYVNRRNKLMENISSGIILFLGNEESAMNYAGNTYHFQQDRTFLYYFGIDISNMAAIIDVESGDEIIFGYDFQIDDIIWMGSQPTLKALAEKVGAQQSAPIEKLSEYLDKVKSQNRTIHYLPPYRPEHVIKLRDLLEIEENKLNENISLVLIKQIISQRSVKSSEEIDEMEKAVNVAFNMHTSAMQITNPGIYEYEISGIIEGIASSGEGGIAFPVIFSKNGETLHNHYHGNLLKAGDLVINDSGAETAMHYASDITRTFPVSGKFSEKQKEIYEIVLETEVKSIEAIKPGIKYRDIHLNAAKIIASGLKDLGLMKGDMDEAVKQGAHALFFPHGLGHMLGLDVHDMENLGENFVGYNEETKRSEQFGFAYLRLGKELKPGYVLTVEPGLYFIPALIDIWQKENKFIEFINYESVRDYIGFGGVRIEDNVLVTESGNRVLGKPIPKTVPNVENTCLQKM
jgi:Xaa-Pro aminopeptidase